MTDISLLTVNWNQRPAMELMLKSFVKWHYNNERLNLVLIDNGSTDDSKQWLRDNNIIFVDNPINRGHEAAINQMWEWIDTQYVLLVDTDVLFNANVFEYIKLIKDNLVAVGELIINPPMIARISPWFLMFDIKKCKEAGIYTFRPPEVESWSYDVASWFTETISKHNFTHHQLIRHPGDQDADLISMKYDLFYHIGKASWDTNHHTERQREVSYRRQFILEELKKYEDIDLKGKFI